MGVTKVTKQDSSYSERPAAGDIIVVEYTGWLHDPSAPHGKGTLYDNIFALYDVRRTRLTVSIALTRQQAEETLSTRSASAKLSEACSRLGGC